MQMLAPGARSRPFSRRRPSSFGEKDPVGQGNFLPIVSLYPFSLTLALHATKPPKIKAWGEKEAPLCSSGLALNKPDSFQQILFPKSESLVEWQEPLIPVTGISAMNLEVWVKKYAML